MRWFWQLWWSQSRLVGVVPANITRVLLLPHTANTHPGHYGQRVQRVVKSQCDVHGFFFAKKLKSAKKWDMSLLATHQYENKCRICTELAHAMLFLVPCTYRGNGSRDHWASKLVIDRSSAGQLPSTPPAYLLGLLHIVMPYSSSTIKNSGL